MSFDAYRILGLDRGATIPHIRAAYKRMARIHHPDKEGGNDEKFREIKLAYDILIDPDRRKRYDQTGRIDKSPVTPEAIRNVMASMINNVIDHEREDGSTDNPDWENIKNKIVLSIRASRREIVINIKHTERRLERAKTLARKFKPRQEEDPIGEIFKARIEIMETQLQGLKDALELSQETEKKFLEYDYEVDEVGPRPEGQFSRGPTLRLSGSPFPFDP